MAIDMKNLKVNADNGSFTFGVVDQEARDAAKEAKNAVAKINIPTSLPNPKKLTFTGGATGEYDGSNEVTITIPEAGEGGSGPIPLIESLDSSNLKNLRDLDTGTYVLYGYFQPYAGAPNTLTFENQQINVARKSAGSHVLVFSTLNSVVTFLEILVDSTAASGFTYSRTNISMLDLHALIAKVGDLEGLNTTEKTDLVAAINEVAASQSSGGNVNQGTGWTSEQIDILDSIGDHINFLDAEGGRLWDSLIASLRSGQGSSAVLTSITAVYSGGSVEAGTQTRELKITVTATYDDGTSKTVTGYTLSPETVSEGENTVTVTYNGKTSTFNVVGIVTPVEVVLESISAVFNGETAQAGTNASDLDITVTGHYSDGSTKTETGWTTAGVVSEGNNVFTIYLGDKTCTVSVVGVAVEEEPVNACYTKIARFEGQTSGGTWGSAQFDSSLIENGKLYAFVLDPTTTVSAYPRITLFGFVARSINGILKTFAPNYAFTMNTTTNGSESGGVVTFMGDNMCKWYDGTFYDLYEVGNDSQVITDGQLFDYVGTIEPTKNSGFVNTLTIPASALTDNSYFAVVPKSYNPEIDYTSYADYERTCSIVWGCHGSIYMCVLANGVNGSQTDITKNDDGSFDIVGESGLRFYAECDLVYDVYRANPTWG